MDYARPRLPKNHSVGFELEAFLVDGEGGLLNAASATGRSLRGKNPFAFEVADSMLEFNSAPRQWAVGSVKSLLEKTALTQRALDKRGYLLLPAGTYPGRSQPALNSKPWYEAQSAIIGPLFSYYASRVCGFHFHFCLPKAALMPGSRSLRVYKKHDLRRRVLYIYNFMVAADPALSTLMQCSPFFEGMLLGKSSRLLAYRDLKLPNVEGLYHNFPEFGGLPRYEHTLTDINEHASLRKRHWQEFERRASGRVSSALKRANPFKFFWGPVRVNQVGTIEQRGMDANPPSMILAASSGLNSVLKRIFYGELRVRQSDDAIARPFSIEGDSILVPPFSYVSRTLQPASAIKGLEDARVAKYCAAYYRLANSLQKTDGTAKLNAPFQSMLLRGRTQSDDMIKFAMRRGFRKGAELEADTAREIALVRAQEFRKESEDFPDLAREFRDYL